MSKANPNLGKTVSYETYQRDVDMIEKSPSEKNDVLAKRFGIPMEGSTYFFSSDGGRIRTIFPNGMDAPHATAGYNLGEGNGGDALLLLI